MSDNDQSDELLRRDEIRDDVAGGPDDEAAGGFPGTPIQGVGRTVGKSLASSFTFPPDHSEPRQEFAAQLRQVEKAERAAEKEAQGVRLHPIKL